MIQIYTVCLNPETGEYLAFVWDRPTVQCRSYTSREEAVGRLVMSGDIDSVIVHSVDEEPSQIQKVIGTI
jgi:hypothetical protein